MKELFKIQKEIFDDKRIFDFSFKQIGKFFLSKLLTIDVYQSDFQTVRNKYIESSENENIEKSENEFYKYICLEYLYLEKEPKETLYSSYQEVTQDLQEIEKNILYINNEIKELETKKQNKDLKYNIEDRYYSNKLGFYKDKNITAKNEIIIFLVNDIKNDAINKSQRDLIYMPFSFKLFSGSMPYRFSKSPIFKYYNEYDVRDLTPISNKFLDLAARAYPDIRNLYDSNKKEFFEFAKMYILEEKYDYGNVINKINTYTETNYILNRRKKILNTIFFHYKNEDYISVVNMLPLQIEGIFHDICIELGISESQSNKTAINKLLEILNEKTQSFHYFEYYSFIFPITRNKVAHGELIEDNLEHTAIMLILDLVPVCELAISEDIKINKVLKLMKIIEKDNNKKNLIEFLEYLDVDIPMFYNITSLRKDILNKYSEDEFWEYIDEEIIKERNENINNSEMIKYINILNRKKIASEKCKIFFKKIPKLRDEIKKSIKNLNILQMY